MNAEAKLIQQVSRAQIHGEVPVSLLKPEGIGEFLIRSKLLDVSLALRNWGPTHRGCESKCGRDKSRVCGEMTP